MNNRTDLDQIATDWLRVFADAVNRRDSRQLFSLFATDGSWRDLLAFTGDVRTTSGANEIIAMFSESIDEIDPYFHISKLDRVSIDRRFPNELVEAFFEFELKNGKGQGVVRLLDAGIGQYTAWTLLTALRELPFFAPRGRPSDSETIDNDWPESRYSELRYEEREPTVLVVGAGQAGLAIAARLKSAGVDCLVLERSTRVGDNWRKRYKSLRLHNQIWANHLPLIPFPETWPTYIPKDKLANWFEFYADALDINVWTDTEFIHGDFDSTDLRWTARIRTAGAERELHPKHLVMATGVSGSPRMPEFPGRDNFEGTVLHSSHYSDGEDFRGKRVLVIGSGTSGHDTAHDLFRHDAKVTIMQRSSTTVLSLEPSAELAYALYREDKSTEECDLIALSTPYPMKCELQRHLTNKISELDQDLIKRLHDVGFQTDTGEDGTGFALKYLRRGGGYYIDIGCSELVATAQIRLVQATNFSHFTVDGITLVDGVEIQFDAVIFATGYASIQDEVRRMLGDEVADKIGPVWGLDDEGELRNICRPTSQPGLWFIAGGFPDARMWSPFLALQIQAAEKSFVLSRQTMSLGSSNAGIF
jgi:lactate dehydrogenase-like 2-hydroxyacid dehydrogenase